MNENESTNTEVVEDPAGSPASESETDQTAPELTPEEKLAERERLVSEREKAIELKERTMNVAKLLKEKGLSPELAEIIRIDSDEKNAENIERLAKLMNHNSSAASARFDTGMDHNSGVAIAADDNDFIRGFNEYGGRK